MPGLQWLLFLYKLPARKPSTRLTQWRTLKRLGRSGWTDQQMLERGFEYSDG